MRSQATEPECNSFTCFQTTSEKEDNRMKNVPVPVYCRPLVEKDPNRKVRRSTFNAGVTKKKKKKKGLLQTRITRSVKETFC